MFPLTLDSIRSRSTKAWFASFRSGAGSVRRRRRVRLGVAQRWTLVGLLALGVLAGAGSLYEYRHVSADLRQSLLAAVAPGATAAENSQLLHSAANRLHTRRDRVEFGRLQQMVAASAGAAHLQAQLMHRLHDREAQLEHEVHSEQLMLVAEQAYLRNHQPVPQSFAEDVVREQIRREELREENRRADETAWLQLLQQRLEARVLAQQLRTDLGFAPSPAQP